MVKQDDFPDQIDDNPVRTRSVINGNTLMPLGVVLAIIVALWRASAYLDNKFAVMSSEVASVNQQLSVIRSAISDRWTIQNMKIWEQDFKIKNPTCIVPDSIEISRMRDSYTSGGGRTP